MTSERDTHRLALSLTLVLALGTKPLHAQVPTINEVGAKEPGSFRSTLGPIPGAGGNPFGLTPGTDSAFLGGRPGPSFSRAPASISTPGGVMRFAPTPGIVAPVRVKITDVPLYGPLEVPDAAEAEGPPDGMTLGAAIDRLVSQNLALQALRLQVPASRADVLTASLRANPIVFADSQLVPNGRYNKDRPGGPTQYDLNVSHPVDYSGKRLARTVSAEVVFSVQEALYRDAVRVQIDNLYSVFVDVLAARETVRYARASQTGLSRLLTIYQKLFDKSDVTRVEVGRASALLDASDLAVIDSEETYIKTRRALSTLLNLPPDVADSLQVRGTIADLGASPPPSRELLRIALSDRPDLAAQRLGVSRARADVRLALANQFGDAYVLYQPYTFQDNSPFGHKSATSYALGLTVPIPIYNRNQGGVVRARLNVAQSSNDVAAVEHRITADVRGAERNYHATREQLHKVEHDLLPAARSLRDDTFRLFTTGEVTALEANVAQKDYNQAVRLYRDLLIRHRRSMLIINTVVGRRVLP